MKPGTAHLAQHAYFASEVYLSKNFFMMFVYHPKSYQEASHDLIWKSAMQEEVNSLQENETWELVYFPPKR